MCFIIRKKGIRIFVHGDEYVSTGRTNELMWMKGQLEKKYQIKTQMLGNEKGQVQEVKIFNRIITWNQQKGILYEADPRHVEIMLEQLSLKDAREVTTPGTSDEGRTSEDHRQPL